MLEQKIEALAEAINNLAAAYKAGGGAAPSGSTGGGRKGGAASSSASKPKHSKAEMQAAVNEVKEKLGTPAAKELIKSVGFEKLAEVTEDKFDALYEAAKAKVADDGDGEGEGGL
ncbi:MAG: hypothetical protein KDG50_06950 [Chromatiales bacterium]|nr:hypothetical protein [Chromatiales bacterium]